MSSTLKPYLRLKDQLSQTWLNKYTIFLALIALKLVLFNNSLQSSLALTKEYTLNSCPTIDSYASNLMSFPHYVAKGANYLIAKSVNEINEKTVDTLDLILTGAEAIIIFALEMLVGTYACILVSAVDGAVDAAVNSTEKIITWVNNSLDDITDDIEDGLTDLSKFLNKVISAADDVEDFFTGDSEDDGNSTLNKVNLTVSSLRDLHIPSSIDSKLEILKDNTPDFEEVKNKTETLIKYPFELIKDKLQNASFLSDNSNELYVPEIQQATICSGNRDKINAFYRQLAKDTSFAARIIVILLIIGALLAILPIVYQQYLYWKRLEDLHKKLAETLQKIPKDGTDFTSTGDPIELIDSTLINRYPSRLGRVASKLTSKPHNKIRIRWLVSYSMSPRATVVLGLALAGIFSVILQYIIMAVLERSVKKSEPFFENMKVELLSDLNSSITDWTDSTNDYLENQEDTINDELFGWVKIATESVNNTVSAFVTDMNEAIAYAFNGTILYNPVKTIVGCVIEDKLIKIEKGLTWIYDNSEITLPRVNDYYITAALTESNTSNATNTTSIESSSVEKIIELGKNAEDLMKKSLKIIQDKYKESLNLELYISVALLILWLIQVFIGLMILLFRYYTSSDSPQIPVISYPMNLFKEQYKKSDDPFDDSNELQTIPKKDFDDDDSATLNSYIRGHERETKNRSVIPNDADEIELSYPKI